MQLELSINIFQNKNRPKSEAKGLPLTSNDTSSHTMLQQQLTLNNELLS